MPGLFARLEKAFKQHASAFPEDPRDTFRRHVSVAPFYEDNMAEIAELIGPERMLFGSDWPHAEGLVEPLAFVHDLAGFSAEAIEQVMRINGEALVQPQVA